MLLSVDTNVLARAMIDDGSEQASRSRDCFLNHQVHIADTVLVETEWLLRSRLRLSRDEINRLFSGLVATPSARFSSTERFANAIVAHAQGMDFADAMHLLGSSACDAFVTFDADFIKRQHLIPGAAQVREPDKIG